MRPLTDKVPKPLLKVGDEALIEHHIHALARAGISRLVINHAYRGELIESYLGDGRKYGVQITYSAEGHGKALETGGGIFNALHLLNSEQFLVVNADIWTDYDYTKIQLSDADAHLVLVKNPAHNPEGDFFLSGGHVLSEGDAKLTFSGIGVYRKVLFNGCKPGAFPLAPLIRDAISRGKVTGEFFEGRWTDVGTPERLEQINRDYSISRTG